MEIVKTSTTTPLTTIAPTIRASTTLRTQTASNAEGSDGGRANGNLPEPHYNPKRLSGTAIALIVIVILVVLAITFGFILFLRRRKERRKRKEEVLKARKKQRTKLRTEKAKLPSIKEAAEDAAPDLSRTSSKNRKVLKWLQDLEAKFKEGAKSSSNNSVGDTHELPADAHTQSVIKQYLRHKLSRLSSRHELEADDVAYQMPA